MINRRRLYGGQQVVFSPLVAPLNFDPSTQNINIFSLYNDYISVDKAYIYSFSDTLNTLSLPVAAGITYRVGYTRSGVDYVLDSSSFTNPFIAGDTKRYVIVNNTANDTFAVLPTGSVWAAFGVKINSIGSTGGNTHLRYVHYVYINSIRGFNFCSNLTGSLTIPNSVTSIEQQSFRDCTNLTGALIIPESLSTIAAGAFWYCVGFAGGLTLPASTVTINADAFIYDANFTELNLSFGYNPIQASDNWKFNFSTKFTAASLNQSIINIAGGGNTFRTITIGATNKSRLLAAYPNAETNANARGITII